MATTKDEAPKDVQVVSQKSFSKSEVVALYQQGKNLNQIAEEVYGFRSEEAVERVRQIIGCE